MADSSSKTPSLNSLPIREMIEEAAREAAEQVRDRNRRMGWPLIVSDEAEDSRVREEIRDYGENADVDCQ